LLELLAVKAARAVLRGLGRSNASQLPDWTGQVTTRSVAFTPSLIPPRDRRKGRVIGGKVVDASALAALIRGRISAVARFTTARYADIVLYLPTLALAEVRTVRPDAAAELAEVLGHPTVVLGELDAANARHVDQLLTNAGVFDATAGHTVHIARQRGWPALSADPASA
jgi:hypothetical protein